MSLRVTETVVAAGAPVGAGADVAAGTAVTAGPAVTAGAVGAGVVVAAGTVVSIRVAAAVSAAAPAAATAATVAAGVPDGAMDCGTGEPTGWPIVAMSAGLIVGSGRAARPAAFVLGLDALDVPHALASRSAAPSARKKRAFISILLDRHAYPGRPRRAWSARLTAGRLRGPAI